MASADNDTAVEPYERRLSGNFQWAMREGDLFFQELSAVHIVLRRLTKQFEERGINYAVGGDLAMFKLGYRRFTEKIEVLVDPDGLSESHSCLPSAGFAALFFRSKHLRDREYGVKIEFCITGELPRHNAAAPVRYPAPDSVAVAIDGIRYIKLVALIELKLAAGMSNTEGLRDLADVIDLVQALRLPRSLGDDLPESLRESYGRQWLDAQLHVERYLTAWPSAGIPAGVKHLGELIAFSKEGVATLQAMLEDGVTLDARRLASGAFLLATAEPAIAAKYDMHDERDFLI